VKIVWISIEVPILLYDGSRLGGFPSVLISCEDDDHGR
jgi:hypothetical protein